MCLVLPSPPLDIFLWKTSGLNKHHQVSALIIRSQNARVTNNVYSTSKKQRAESQQCGEFADILHLAQQCSEFADKSHLHHAYLLMAYIFLLVTAMDPKTQCVIILPCQTLEMAQQINTPFTPGPSQENNESSGESPKNPFVEKRFPFRTMPPTLF